MCQGKILDKILCLLAEPLERGIFNYLIHNAHRIQLTGGSMRKKQELDET